VSLIQRLLSRSRLKSVRQALADDPSAKNYLALAHEHARTGEMEEVQRVCAEALESFPGHPELQRLCDRAHSLVVESRTRELVRELHEAPRPGLYRELCELYLETGRVEKAEETATTWFQESQDPGAQLLHAEARLRRFLADKRREDGRMTAELLDQAEKLLPGDDRPLRLRLDLMWAVGAWRDARKVLSQLLEIAPGDPELEARFRSLASCTEGAPSFDAALRESERSGKLQFEEPSRATSSAPALSVRPMLKELASSHGVEAALFERGATALVQGPRGATAERTARAVREIVQKGRTTSRRLGLGSPSEIEIEGEFGSVFIAAADHGSAAVWCSQRQVPDRYRATVRELVGDGSHTQIESAPDEERA
jgi:tetratricopeptide (TPR) repeat protein